MGGATNTWIENPPSDAAVEEYGRQLAEADPLKANLGPRLREMLAEAVVQEQNTGRRVTVEIDECLVTREDRPFDGTGDRIKLITEKT